MTSEDYPWFPWVHPRKQFDDASSRCVAKTKCPSCLTRWNQKVSILRSPLSQNWLLKPHTQHRPFCKDFLSKRKVIPSTQRRGMGASTRFRRKNCLEMGSQFHGPATISPVKGASPLVKRLSRSQRRESNPGRPDHISHFTCIRLLFLFLGDALSQKHLAKYHCGAGRRPRFPSHSVCLRIAIY